MCYSLKVADEQWSFPVAVWPAPGGKREAGSLGQVRQAPLNPCRESLERTSHCMTREFNSLRALSAPAKIAGRSLRLCAAR